MPDTATALFSKNATKIENPWQVLPADFNGSLAELAPAKLLLPLKLWLAEKDQLPAGIEAGVWLNSDQEVEVIGDSAAQCPVVAINFPGFMDGRGFSLGRILRERYGFTGELRAIGNIIRDQVFFLKRCGFDSFELPGNLAAEDIEASLQVVNITYQSAVDSPDPLFRREAL